MSYLTDDEQSRREVALQRSLDRPMPRALERAVESEIEPHTMNVGIDHGEAMIAVAIAYPLIVDYLREHSEKVTEWKGDKRGTLWGSVVEVVRAAPTFYHLKVWRWLAEIHSPLDVGPPTYAWCPTCRKPWPCTEWIVATDEVVALERRAACGVTE